MPVRNSLADEIATAAGLKSLVTAYEEIAVMRIKRVRNDVLAARLFLDGLAEVFARVRASRQREVAKQLRQRHKKKKGSGESSVTVLLSTQKRLSGTITRKVVDMFAENIQAQDQPSDAVVVGSAARNLLSRLSSGRRIKYFKMPRSSAAAPLQLRPIVNHLLQYDKVTIYYGRFVNLVNQQPAATRLYQETLWKEGQQEKQAKPEYFLFEPSLEQVVDFFDREVFANLFRRAVDESQLAHLGSRITAMEQASSNIDKELAHLMVKERRVIKDRKNSKQRQALTGMSLWSLSR